MGFSHWKLLIADKYSLPVRPFVQDQPVNILPERIKRPRSMEQLLLPAIK
jgi:hypothetical protein